MIEISHTQARRLIREALDGGSSKDHRLSLEQWAALQAHLECCPDCRAYQERLSRVERGLTRTLRLRWNPVRGPLDGVVADVLLFRRARRLRRRNTLYAIAAAIVVILLLTARGYQVITTPPPTPTPTPLPPGVTPSPTPIRSAFRNGVVFAAERDGNSEIILLNPGVELGQAELINLTQHPGNDYAPAWSPDGEWLAFLSDRAGWPDLYVMHVAGSRLTRLTADPSLDLQGPLSWSSDGRWIALSGQRSNTSLSLITPGPTFSERFVYLVPLDGTRPRSLGFTSGFNGWLSFAPTQLLLAYGTGESPGSGLMLYDLSKGWFTPLAQFDNRNRDLKTGINGAFDWSPDGTHMVYLAEGPYDPVTGLPFGSSPGVQIKTTLDLGLFGRQVYDSTVNQVVESIPRTGALREVTYVPAEDGRVVAYLQDEDGSGCWTLHMHLVLQRDARPSSLSGLCLEGRLGRENWSPDGRWLVALAHRPGETVSGLYALHVPPGLPAGPSPATFERLSTVEFPADADGILPSPRVRASLDLLGINPRPVTAPEAVEPPSVPPVDTPGRLVFTLLPPTGSTTARIISANPDGTGVMELTGADSRNTCPAYSPDGTQIAFLSDRASGTAGLNDVFVMQAGGGEIRQLTQPVFPVRRNDAGDPFPQYGCPVWSPNGLFLASVVMSSPEGAYHLAIFPADGRSPSYIRIQPAAYTPPVWSADGDRVILVYWATGQYQASIVSIGIDTVLGGLPNTRTLVSSEDWSTVFGIALAPQGETLTYIPVTIEPDQGLVLDLREVSLDGSQSVEVTELARVESTGYIGGRTLAYLPDGRLVIAIRYRSDALNKAGLLLSDGESLVPLAVLPDVLYDIAPSPDGRWVALATETGLWVIDIPASLEGRASPAMIYPGRVYQVDWK